VFYGDKVHAVTQKYTSIVNVTTWSNRKQDIRTHLLQNRTFSYLILS